MPPPAPDTSSSRRAEVEALGDWVQAFSSSVSNTLNAGMNGLAVSMARGPTPPPPHDPTVLSEIIIEHDPDSVNLKSTEDISEIVLPVAIPEASDAVPKKKAFFSGTRKLEGKGTVLTPERSELLREALPIFLQDETLTLLYSVLTHGSDTASFFSHTQGFPYTVIVIQACSGEIFGGFAASSWRQSNKYYGEGQSFVFQLGKRSICVHYYMLVLRHTALPTQLMTER